MFVTNIHHGFLTKMPWTNPLMDNMFQKPRSLPNEPQHAGSTKNHVLVTSFASQFAHTQLFENAVKNMLYIQVFKHQFRFWCLPKCVPIEKATGSVFAIDYFFVNGISWAQVRSTPYSSWMVLLWGLFHLPLLVVLKNEMCYCVMMGGRTNWWKHSSARNSNKCQIHLMVFVFIDWWFHVTLAVEVFAWHKQHRCGIFLSGAFWICS